MINKKKCPQCKNLISVKAPTCLFCGRPNKFVTSNYVKSKWEKKLKNKKLNIFKIIISSKTFFIFISVLIILFIILSK